MAPIVVLDLTTSSGQTILWEILASDRLFSAHLGLPCGTWSKARERPVPERLRRMGVPSPISRFGRPNTPWVFRNFLSLTV